MQVRENRPLEAPSAGQEPPGRCHFHSTWPLPPATRRPVGPTPRRHKNAHRV